MCFLQSKQKTAGYPLLEVAGEKLFRGSYIDNAKQVDEIYTEGRYIVLSKAAHPIFINGAILISIRVIEYILQIAISLGTKELFYRNTKEGAAWGAWYKIIPEKVE